MAEQATLPEVLELEGAEAEAFLEYDKRKLTEKEMESLVEADAFYKKQCPKH
jgi:hypothetical protein